MDASTFLALASVCAPLVHPGTARAIAQVESSLNPNAIGIVRGLLERQPRNAKEAVATANALKDEGWNFSVGLTQINLHNLARLQLSLETAFEPCANLNAMQRLLRECEARVGVATDDAQRNLRRALSCYYSGDAVTGIRHGYVARVVRAAAAHQGVPRAPP